MVPTLKIKWMCFYLKGTMLMGITFALKKLERKMKIRIKKYFGRMLSSLLFLNQDKFVI